MQLEINRCTKVAFSVIGKEGSTNDGMDFILKLWTDANSHFNEVAALAKKDENGNLVGIWGAMSDFSRSYKPWEEKFTKGLYLAGVEVEDDAEAPPTWVKWTIPSFEYIYVKNDGPATFPEVLKYLRDNNMTLAGAVHDFNCPETGQAYMFFPINRI